MLPTVPLNQPNIPTRKKPPNNNRIQIEVPPRSKIGDRRRLNGQGHDGGPLDIEFSIIEPEKLTKKQLEGLEKLKDLGL